MPTNSSENIVTRSVTRAAKNKNNFLTEEEMNSAVRTRLKMLRRERTYLLRAATPSVSVFNRGQVQERKPTIARGKTRRKKFYKKRTPKRLNNAIKKFLTYKKRKFF